MVGCLAVEAGALAAGICRNHAADRGAVRCGQFGREEQAVGLERLVELVLHDAGLDPCDATHRVDLQNTVHVAGTVDDKPGCQGLTVGPGSTTARRDGQMGECRLAKNLCNDLEIINVARKNDGHGLHLVDGIVRGKDCPRPRRCANISDKAGLDQALEKPCRWQKATAMAVPVATGRYIATAVILAISGTIILDLWQKARNHGTTFRKRLSFAKLGI